MPETGSQGGSDDTLAHRLLRVLAQNIPHRVYAKDAQGRFIFANQAVAAGMGVASPAELIGRTDFDFYPPEDARRYFEQEQGLLRTAVPMHDCEEHVKYLLLDREAWLLTTKIPLLDDDGAAVGLVGINYDITPQKVAERALHEEMHRRTHVEDQLRRQAHYDPLTGLPNRRLLHERMEQAIGRAGVSGRALMVLFVDLDRFKDVNDSLGHNAGDELLEIVTRRLGRCIRSGDTLARLGGDEFVLLLEGGEADPVLEPIATRVMQAVTAPATLAGRELSVTCSIGCSVYPDDGEDADTLLKRADAAMYDAKEHGRNRVCRYAHTPGRDATVRFEIESQLRRALERDELVLHFQPQIRFADQAIVGVEALVRWQHPERGLVGPLEFIPIAEQSGLIGSIGRWVLHAACEQAMAWRRAGLPALRMSVNLSARQLQDPDLEEQVLHALDATGLPADMLELELTESASMKSPQDTMRIFASLHARGIGVAIDDFGTGYSNLAYLARFPVHRIKLDRSFVNAMMADTASRTIVETMIGMAHKLQLEIVAEGVETTAQRDQLAAYGCDLMQGYLFSRPLDGARCEALLRDKHAERGRVVERLEA